MAGVLVFNEHQQFITSNALPPNSCNTWQPCASSFHYTFNTTHHLNIL
jgi:hypothetical protein